MNQKLSDGWAVWSSRRRRVFVKVERRMRAGYAGVMRCARGGELVLRCLRGDDEERGVEPAPVLRRRVAGVEVSRKGASYALASVRECSGCCNARRTKCKSARRREAVWRRGGGQRRWAMSIQRPTTVAPAWRCGRCERHFRRGGVTGGVFENGADCHCGVIGVARGRPAR